MENESILDEIYEGEFNEEINRVYFLMVENGLEEFPVKKESLDDYHIVKPKYNDLGIFHKFLKKFDNKNYMRDQI